jgi:hypothetical protein
MRRIPAMARWMSPSSVLPTRPCACIVPLLRRVSPLLGRKVPVMRIKDAAGAAFPRGPAAHRRRQAPDGGSPSPHEPPEPAHGSPPPGQPCALRPEGPGTRRPTPRHTPERARRRDGSASSHGEGGLPTVVWVTVAGGIRVAAHSGAHGDPRSEGRVLPELGVSRLEEPKRVLGLGADPDGSLSLIVPVGHDHGERPAAREKPRA